MAPTMELQVGAWRRTRSSSTVQLVAHARAIVSRKTKHNGEEL